MDEKEASTLLYKMTGGDSMWSPTVESELHDEIIDIYTANAKARGLSQKKIDAIYEDAPMGSSFESLDSDEMRQQLIGDMNRIKAESKSPEEYEKKFDGLVTKYIREAYYVIDGEAINALTDSENILYGYNIPDKDQLKMEKAVWNLRDKLIKEGKSQTPTYKQKIIGVMAEKGILASQNPKGWHNEPINHALASKGIKVGKGRTKR